MRAAQVDHRLDAIAGTPLYYGTPGTTEPLVGLDRYTVAIVGDRARGEGEEVYVDATNTGNARLFISTRFVDDATVLRFYTTQGANGRTVTARDRHVILANIQPIGSPTPSQAWVDGTGPTTLASVVLDGPTRALRFGRDVGGARPSTVHAAAIWPGNLTHEQAVRASAWLTARHG